MNNLELNSFNSNFGEFKIISILSDYENHWILGLTSVILEKDDFYYYIQEEKDKIHQDQINELTKKLLKMESKIYKSNNKTINTNNGSINNGNINTINNNITIKFGDETALIDYHDLLNKKELEFIIKRQYCAIQESIKLKLIINEKYPSSVGMGR